VHVKRINDKERGIFGGEDLKKNGLTEEKKKLTGLPGVPAKNPEAFHTGS